MDVLNDAGCHLAIGCDRLSGRSRTGQPGDNGQGASPSEEIQEPQTPSPADEDGTPGPSGGSDNKGEEGDLPRTGLKMR